MISLWERKGHKGRKRCREIRKNIKESLNSAEDSTALGGLDYKLLRNLAEKKLKQYNHFFL